MTQLMVNIFIWYKYTALSTGNVLSDVIVDTVLYVWHYKWGTHSSGTDIEALAYRNVLSEVIVDTVLYVRQNGEYIQVVQK